MPNPQEIDRRFTYNKPDAETAAIHEKLNELFKDLAHDLDEILPESREKALALTALQETRMWANATIATVKR